MTRKLKKSQKKVLVAIRNYRSNLLEEYLVECQALLKQMSPLFQNGVDPETGICVPNTVDKTVQEKMELVTPLVIEQAEKLLTEILSGYWKKDSRKLFEILDSEATVFSLFSCYEEQISKLVSLKLLYNTAGDHLSTYLELK